MSDEKLFLLMMSASFLGPSLILVVYELIDLVCERPRYTGPKLLRPVE